MDQRAVETQHTLDGIALSVLDREIRFCR